MSEAIERFHTGALTGHLKHDGDLRLQTHVLNAVRRESRNGYILSKEKPKSKKKIDAAIAAILAYEAAGDALADGRYRARAGSRAVGM
ncbi:terminase TerL endonuclease subunit [Actinomadura rubrisoli]|uniref:terminase TerL endonuclease subunit n=1 Tax=Actinomadura rubrisoli TaxID=2530368 RepID=UPI00140456CA|nr:terminase TerL endonuclease subunit [Actinomadura rubrisoli]